MITYLILEEGDAIDELELIASTLVITRRFGSSPLVVSTIHNIDCLEDTNRVNDVNQ